MEEQNSVLFICLANHCRSPMAEAIFLQLIKEKGIYNQWKVDSAAINPWHIGESPEARTMAILKKYKISYKHKGRQIRPEDFNEFNYILAMDNENIADLKKLAPPNSKAKILLLGEFDPKGDKIIQDPYFFRGLTGFEKCYEQCRRSCAEFLKKTQQN